MTLEPHARRCCLPLLSTSPPRSFFLPTLSSFARADFGHILGHFKYKMGIKRERALFVFTPQMAHVLGGREGAAFQDFLSYSCRAYLVLRRHRNLIITLFSLMISCGLPELRTGAEIDWVRRALRLDLDDDDAAERAFRQVVFDCLDTRFTQVNDFFHMLKHA